MEFLIEKVFEQFEKNLRIVLEKHDVQIDEIQDALQEIRIKSKDSLQELRAEFQTSIEKEIKELYGSHEKVVERVETLEKSNTNTKLKLALICSSVGACVGGGTAVNIHKILEFLAKF